MIKIEVIKIIHKYIFFRIVFNFVRKAIKDYMNY